MIFANQRPQSSSGSVCSLVRLKYIPVLIENQLTFFAHASPFVAWSTVELGMGIVANSLAALRPLVRLILRRTGLTQNDTLRSTAAGTKDIGLSGIHKSTDILQTITTDGCSDTLTKTDLELGIKRSLSGTVDDATSFEREKAVELHPKESGSFTPNRSKEIDQL